MKIERFLWRSGTAALFVASPTTIAIAGEAMPIAAESPRLESEESRSTEANPIRHPPAISPPELLQQSTPKQSAAPQENSLRQLDRPIVEMYGHPMGQVTSVSQLRDVQPTDWAFQALQSLVERYGCIAGYPDGTYRGNRALTRFEFAAGLNACLDRINELIAAATADLLTRDDLLTVGRLQAEFAAELATLRGRIDALEARAAELEANQFSTTVKFGGEVIFGLAAAGGGDPPGEGDDRNAIFGQLTRLGLVSSFSGKDRLRIGLIAANFANAGFAGNGGLGTDMALLSYQADSENQFDLDILEYRFAALGDRVVFTLRPVGFSLSSVLTANSPYFDNGRGAISRFGEATPLLKLGNLDAGVGFDWLVTNRLRLQVAYGTRDSNDPERGRGIAGADHSAVGVQLLAQPFNRVLTGISYINTYSDNGQLDTFTGSLNADTSGFINEPMQIHAVGGSLQWRILNNLTFGTWGGFTFANSVESDNYANTETYLFSLGYSDPFGREGDLLAFLFGQPPKLVDGRGLRFGDDEDTSLHLELFYRFRLNDHISITPGVFYVTNPEHNDDNDDIVIGTIRTVFRF